ncbi:hypothetical protein LSTR_LSTR006302 [Laodelphax striatellus]|uniref:PLD phosphodiesterase domain-containing protein n=1 Tax=Laodelphax striatellus TaxID=195883 RepID=A0A482X550_LAOST|nr:hypothetical protein LSTR_LSTR006302 [Laodelphax striatellus]
MPFLRRNSKSKLPTLQDGLFKIGCQAYHILVHDNNDNQIASYRTPAAVNPSDNPFVVIIPSSNPKAAQNRDKNKKRRFSRVFDSGPSHDFEDWDSHFMLRTDPDDFGRNDEFSLVESIPQGMSYRNGSTPFPSTFSVWSSMLEEATSTIEIASSYWTLRDSDVVPQSVGMRREHKFPGSDEGEKIFKGLLEAGTDRKLTIKIAQDLPAARHPNYDTEYLASVGVAQVRSLNFRKLVGAGILHTKLWIVDRKSAYVGSANLDWRSLTQVKEMGIYIKNCSCLVNDIGKIFDVYWMLGLPNAVVPSQWPDNVTTTFNKATPLPMSINSSNISIYASTSPPKFCPNGRTSDISAVLDVISKARKFIFIAVMDYFPLTIYSQHPKYWGVIDDALKTAAIENGAEVRLLISWWDHSRESAKYFLRSLVALTGAYPGLNISAKLFVVPSTAEQSQIPYARVNHNKYMVTKNQHLSVHRTGQEITSSLQEVSVL